MPHVRSVPGFATNILVYFGGNHAKNDGMVRLQLYQSMPHVFPVFENHPSAKTCFAELAKFVKEVTAGEICEARFEVIDGKGHIEKQILDLDKYSINFSKAEVAFQNILF